ncbi:hypothetical protein CDH05_08985 [Pseudomonas lactis]|nr:hypothetical protein CDH05_08985 [Pseudomonas lactis]
MDLFKGYRQRTGILDRSHALVIVPTLCVGMNGVTLCVTRADAERPERHSHAEHGDDQSGG